MNRIRSVVLVLVILGLFLPVMVTTGDAKVQRDKIKIGALGPLAITPGKDMKKGAELAVQEINDGAGVDIGGTAYDLELIVETTSHETTGLPDANTAVPNVIKLQDQDEVVAMLGLFRTEVTMAVQAELDRPFLGVGSTAPIINPYFWRLSPSNGTMLTTSLLELYGIGLYGMGVRNVTIVREDALWSLAMRGSIVEYLNKFFPSVGYMPGPINFTNDVKLAEGATYATVESALTPIKSKLDGLNVNAIMTIFSGPAGKHITEAWAALNMTQYLAGINVEAQSSTHFAETGGAAYGEITLMGFPPDYNQTTKSGPFRQAFYDEYGELPTYTAAASYDAVYVIKDAIERADATTPTAIQTALTTTDYLGAQYKVKFTSEPNVFTHYYWGYPFGQVTYADNGSRILIPNVPTNLTVHEIFTPGGYGASGGDYISTYWVQWQQNGTQKTILGDKPGVNITTDIEWPINHAEHGYTEPAKTPGFESSVALFVLANMAMIVHLRKRKKR
ncbi:MAG: ABC transporter substrate-binding protein [Candidatus Odinarchaeota archaeon]